MERKVITIDYVSKTTLVSIETESYIYSGTAQCHEKEKFEEKIGLKVATARANVPFLADKIQAKVDTLYYSTGELFVNGKDLQEIDELAKQLRRSIKHITDETRNSR
jgi:DNA-binding XRE family transcriptional regulator